MNMYLLNTYFKIGKNPGVAHTEQQLNKASSIYRKTSNISRTLVSNKIVDHSDVVGALPVGATPTTSSFFT